MSHSLTSLSDEQELIFNDGEYHARVDNFIENVIFRNSDNDLSIMNMLL